MTAAKVYDSLPSMSQKQEIITITPFSRMTWEKVLKMCAKGKSADEIRELVEVDLKNFNANIMSNQNEKIALEVVQRLSRGEKFSKIAKEPHMPQENIIRAAIANCREANDILIAMNALTNKNVINKARDALAEMAELSMKDEPSDEDNQKIRNLKMFVDATRQSCKDGLIEMIEESSKEPDYVSMMEGANKARLEGMAQLTKN